MKFIDITHFKYRNIIQFINPIDFFDQWNCHT